MKTTVKERVAKHRKKVYEDEEAHAKIKEKDKERKRKQRQLIKIKGGLEAEKMRQNAARYRRNTRAKLKSMNEVMESADAEPGVSLDNVTPQSVGKAMQRVERALPKSPRKRVIVIGKMLSKVSPKRAKMIVKLSSMKKFKPLFQRKKRSDAIEKTQLEEIERFFSRDDISRMCPGRKEFVSVKTSVGREHRQKRILLFNLREVHEMFLVESATKVGFSKFCSMRPAQVILTAQRGQEVCMCEYHENVEMCLEGISKVVPSVTKNAREVLEETVCSMTDEKCIDRQCDECGVSKLDHHFDEIDDDTEVEYRKWVKTEKNVKKDLLSTDIVEAKEDLYKQMEPFARHVYNVKRQHKELKFLKEHLKTGCIIIQEDFAENYTLKQQKEVMAAHWAPEQVTVFTVVVYYDKDGKQQHSSFAVVSDELEHNKQSVYAYNKVVIEQFKKSHAFEIDHIHYWTDGCGAQFKNKFTLSNLLHHQKDFGCTADWNFFETAHGKGPVDGIGGQVKRSVWRCTMQGRDAPSNAKDFYEIAQREAKSVSVLFVEKDYIRTTTEEMHLEDRWKECKPIPGTRKFHFFQPSESNAELVGSVNSAYECADLASSRDCTMEERPHPEQSEVPDHIKITSGDYIMAEFIGKKTSRRYVGQVNCMLIHMYNIT